MIDEVILQANTAVPGLSFAFFILEVKRQNMLLLQLAYVLTKSSINTDYNRFNSGPALELCISTYTLRLSYNQ